ncbi:TPA: SHOCT domain-containing protein, partial [Streptococcus pyogenes]|nr:SHOCT domain-containing protein [Streptococcus pyogenes]
LEQYKYNLYQHQSPQKTATVGSEDAVAEIRKFKKLYDEGILTEEEFIAKKKIILGI